jgi:hypothetical protein
MAIDFYTLLLQNLMLESPTSPPINTFQGHL